MPLAHIKIAFFAHGNRRIISPLSPLALNRNHFFQGSQLRLDFLRFSLSTFPVAIASLTIPPHSQTRSNRIPSRGGLHHLFRPNITPIISTAKTPHIPAPINIPTTNYMVCIKPQPNNRLCSLWSLLCIWIHIPRFPFAWMAFGVGEHSCGSRGAARGGQGWG